MEIIIGIVLMLVLLPFVAALAFVVTALANNGMDDTEDRYTDFNDDNYD